MSSTLQQAPDWTPIRRSAAPDVRGLSAEAHDRLHVRLKLNVRPPADWVKAFDDLPQTERAMAVRQDEVYLNLPDAELESYVREADARIAATNQEYETSVLPPIRSARERQRTEGEDAERRVREARLTAASFVPSESEERGRITHTTGPMDLTETPIEVTASSPKGKS